MDDDRGSLEPVAPRDARVGRWSQRVGIAALAAALSLVWLMPVGVLHALASRAAGVQLPMGPFVWAFVVGAFGAGLAAALLGWRSRRSTDVADRRRAFRGRVCGLVGLAVASAWLAAGGWFGLFWDI